jgi:hypothetical protein
MDVLREIVVPKNGKILVRIPKNYPQKRFEVIVIPIEDTETDLLKAKMNAFLNTLPNAEPLLSEVEIIDEIKAVRQKRYANH